MDTKKSTGISAAGVFQKTCSKCGQTKPIFDPDTGKTNFYKSSVINDGYHCWCKVCHNLYTSDRKRSKKRKPEPKVGKTLACPETTQLVLEPESSAGAIQADPVRPVKDGTEESCIILDFSAENELFVKLLARAKKARRTPVQQILFILETT